MCLSNLWRGSNPLPFRACLSSLYSRTLGFLMLGFQSSPSLSALSLYPRLKTSALAGFHLSATLRLKAGGLHSLNTFRCLPSVLPCFLNNSGVPLALAPYFLRCGLRASCRFGGVFNCLLLYSLYRIIQHKL